MKLSNKTYFLILTVCIIILVTLNTILMSQIRVLDHNNQLYQSQYNQIQNLAIRMQEELTDYKAAHNISEYDPRNGIMKVPFNRIQEEQIKVYPEYVLITRGNIKWARFANTGSMVPVFDDTSNALEIVPNKEEDIHIGDIIAYKYEHKTITHRVIQIREDTKGWYALAKGDNNEYPDPKKIRFTDIERVVIGILY